MHGVLPTVYRIRKLVRAPKSQQKGCRAIEEEEKEEEDGDDNNNNNNVFT
jgi:hypothetical protein